MIAAEQRHGNAGKAVVGRETLIVAISIAKNFVDADDARQRRPTPPSQARSVSEPKCHHTPPRSDSARGANLVTPFRAPQKHIDQARRRASARKTPC